MKIKTLKVVLVALISFLASNAVFAEEEEFGCLVGDCQEGRGTLVKMTERGVIRYVGKFVNGRYHGFGRLTYIDERLHYKGNWQHGLRSGRGVLWDNENNVYFGLWSNDRRNGQGAQYYHVDGWKEDLHGEEWLVKNTENYTGMFKNDVFYGQGTYRWPDGVKYVGGWAANKKHGEGYFDYDTGFRSDRKFEFDERVYE